MGLLASALVASMLAGAADVAPDEDTANALKVFDQLSLPNVANLQWVQVGDRGQGWMVRPPPQLQVLPLGPDVVSRFPKERTTPADFQHYCEDYLASGVEEPTGQEELARGMAGELPRYAAAAMLAEWNVQRGDPVMARRLANFAEQALQSKRGRDAFFGRHPSVADTLQAAVADAVAMHLRWQAIEAAGIGEDWDALRHRWGTIRRLPSPRTREEADRMVDAYLQFAQEEPMREAGLSSPLVGRPGTPEQKAALLIEQLRDLRVAQSSYPGGVNVLDQTNSLEGPNPAKELVALGTAGVDTIIDHLTDARPTRSEGAWRLYAPDTFFLFTFGDVCQQVFEAITHHVIYRRANTGATMSGEGKALEAQAEARRWWEGHRDAPHG